MADIDNKEKILKDCKILQLLRICYDNSVRCGRQKRTYEFSWCYCEFENN